MEPQITSREFKSLMSGLRAHARKSRKKATTQIRLNDTLYTLVAPADNTPIILKTSMISQRPRKALIADALQWAARYRLDAKQNPIRNISIGAAKISVAEARSHRTRFDALP